MRRTLQLISEHSLLILLTAGTVFSFVWLNHYKDCLQMNWWMALILSVLHTLIGVLTVKVFAVLETLDLSNAGNMSLFGGIFFMPLVYWAGAKITKRDMARVFDIFTICMIFTVMCARINCIFGGCCFGMLIPGMGEMRWPTRELEIIFYLILLLILGRKITAGKTNGEIYPIYMAAYGAFRFIVEFFRVSDSSLGIVHLSHVWAMLSFGMGISIYYELQSRRNRERR